MFCKQRNFCMAKGLLIGSIILITLLGASINKYQSSRNSLTYDEALNRIQTERIREVNIPNNSPVKVVSNTENSSNITINFDNHSSNAFVYLIQILFWAFLLSPPIIVVLLLVIIKKMHDKSSMK